MLETCKNTLETCKNPRPTSGQSELPKSCTTSTMNFHMVYFSWIPQNNARLKLSCKFVESKCNPYWDVTLTTSHSTNYVINEHLDFSQDDPYVIPSEMVLWYSYSASFKNQTEMLIDLLHWWTHLTLIISLTMKNAIPSQIMPRYSYPANLMNQNEIPIELTY